MSKFQEEFTVDGVGLFIGQAHHQDTSSEHFCRQRLRSRGASGKLRNNLTLKRGVSF